MISSSSSAALRLLASQDAGRIDTRCAQGWQVSGHKRRYKQDQRCAQHSTEDVMVHICVFAGEYRMRRITALRLAPTAMRIPISV
jgi:hypothetical protein